MIYHAFKQQAQIPVPDQMHHYFKREEWIKAVTTGDSSHFCAQRQKIPVQKASTIQEKVAICPNLAPVFTWCAKWLQAAHRWDRKWIRLCNAHDAARKQAMAEAEATQSLLSSEFTQTLEALRLSVCLNLRSLLRFAGLNAEPPIIPSEAHADIGTESGLTLENEIDGLSDNILSDLAATRSPACPGTVGL